MKDQIIVIDDLVFNADDSAEAYVENCDHCHDPTIHICNNPKHYNRMFKRYGEIAVMTAVIAHENLHTAIINAENNHASVALDILFGTGINYPEEYHGLCRLKYRLRSYAK